MNRADVSHHESPNRKPPEVGGVSAVRAWHWLRTPYTFLDRCAGTLGRTFTMKLPGMGRVLVTGDADLIEATARNKALVGGRGTRALRPILGEHSLIVLEGQRHRGHRRSIAPSFSADEAARFDELTVQVCREFISPLSPGDRFSVQAMTRAISLRLIVRVLFGELCGERERRLISLVDTLMRSFEHPAVLFVKALHRDFGRLSPWGRFLRNRAALRSFIVDEIDERRRRPDSGGALIDRLIAQQRDGQFEPADDAIFEELMSLLLFGHDTAAGTLAWAFHHVHQDPSVVEQLRDESRAADAPGRLVGACIRESQRLCPVVVHLTRVATRATRVGEYALREGESVLPCLYLAQRDPAYFPEPTRFRPQRFLQRGRVPAWSSFPFGFGARKCVGATFARRQMELILYAFMRHANLAADAPVRPVREMLLIVPSGGTVMRLDEHASS
jgi:cytochrome P450